MVRHGYTSVAEFHYVHHDNNGKQYNNLSEMGSRLISAAKTAGINITLVPIFYQKGGFGKAPLEGQKRFITPTIEEYLQLLESSKNDCKEYDGANIGIGIHSMRGVEPKDIAELAKTGPQDIPFHIHISEQLKEIEIIKSNFGSRPVEWLLDNVNINSRWCLIHATHMLQNETKNLAKSGAVVGLCPLTEANLGDGIFPFLEYQNRKGNWAIGTDSHVGRGPASELRLLEYGQRLKTLTRNVAAGTQQKSTGRALLDAAWSGGAKASGRRIGSLVKGARADIVILDPNHPDLLGLSEDDALDAWIFSGDETPVSDVFTGGNHVVRHGRHVAADNIYASYAAVAQVLAKNI